MLKEWKVAIISVGQGYESTEGRNDYKTSTGITYGGQGQPMDIGKSNENFKDGKLKCFNCNKYGHIAKECRSKKKERETRKCFKCDKEEHIASATYLDFDSTIKPALSCLSNHWFNAFSFLKVIVYAFVFNSHGHFFVFCSVCIENFK